MAYLKHQPHGGGERDPLVTGKCEHLEERKEEKEEEREEEGGNNNNGDSWSYIIHVIPNYKFSVSIIDQCLET